ncbi:hypothetical protein B0H63DRAFT_519300 [Podospora didyma]|uniref:Uncharacterized protein n=1 Tax=Podospora didyma TaxID=330526 RepID=A0AAE0NYP5_9PEZI|nr:hypothetical protein B0H63DRAFT_519300 [Podospora didyma]
MWFGTRSICSLLLWQGVVHGSPLQRRAAPCDELEYIIDDYGTIEGTLQGAMILLPMSGTEAGDVTRKFLTLLDDATLHAHALYNLIPTCSSPPEGQFGKRQSGKQTCNALTQVSADVAQTAALMTKLARAKDLPQRIYMEPLQEAADDAASKIAAVQDTLMATDGCVKS